jgi:L-iditol 2-dehydrogenase
MKQAVLTGPRTFELVDVPCPVIAPDEVLMRVAVCGVCASELDMWAGIAEVTYPLSLGHEASGIVEEVGADVEDLAVGDRVAAWITAGGFGELVAVKAQYCHAAGDVPLNAALGEPIACALNAVDLTRVRLGDDVLIVGAGFMGNLVQELVAMSGASRVIVADTRSDALGRATQLGADHVVNVAEQSITDVIDGLTGGRGVDVSFEVTGAQQPLNWLGDVTRMSGKIALAGFHQGGNRTLPMAQWNYMAFQVLNCHFRDVGVINDGMARAMRLLRSRRLSVERLVSHVFPLDSINEAFATLHEKPAGFVKANVVVDPTAAPQ